MTEETPKEKTSKAPAWIKEALNKKKNQSHGGSDNYSKDVKPKSSKSTPDSKITPPKTHRSNG